MLNCQKLYSQKRITVEPLKVRLTLKVSESESDIQNDSGEICSSRDSGSNLNLPPPQKNNISVELFKAISEEKADCIHHTSFLGHDEVSE